MKVEGTVITSSPGPTPRARSASHNASVPLPTPAAQRVLQKAANSFSKASTKGPPANAPAATTSPMASRIPPRIGS